MKVFVVIALCVATVAVIQASPTADLREQATDLTSIEAADSQQSDSNVESSERSGRSKRFIFHLLKWAYLCSVANSVTAVKVAQPVTYQVRPVTYTATIPQLTVVKPIVSATKTVTTSIETDTSKKGYRK